MYKPSYLECNDAPSQLNTSTDKTGVASALTALADKDNKPHYNGATIESMRGNPLFDRVAEIDKVGLAQKKVTEMAKIVHSKRAMIRQFNETAQHVTRRSSAKK